MAFTRSMARRTWGRRAPRSDRKTRSRFPRRNFRRTRRNVAYSSQRGNTTFAGFRSRKMPYRKYKRVLWNASTLAEHHRSVIMNSNSHSAASTNILMKIMSYPMISDNFWATVGGSVDGDITFDGDIFIRGGMCTLRVRNNGDAPVTVVVWKISTTDNGSPILLYTGGGSDRSAMWDPSVVLDFEKNYRIRQRFAFAVEPNDSNNLMHYIKSQKIEGSNWNDGSRPSRRDFWVVGINSAGTTSPNCTINWGHNMSFTTDRV